MTSETVSQRIIDRLTSYNNTLGTIGAKNNEIMTSLDKQAKDVNDSLKKLLISIHEAFKKLKDTRDVMARAGQPTTEIDAQLAKIVSLLDDIEKKSKTLGVDALGSSIAKTLEEIKAYIDQNALTLAETEPRISKPESRGFLSGLFGRTGQSQPAQAQAQAQTRKYDYNTVFNEIATNKELFEKFDKLVKHMTTIMPSKRGTQAYVSNYNLLLSYSQTLLNIKNVSQDVKNFFKIIDENLRRVSNTEEPFTKLQTEITKFYNKVEEEYTRLNEQRGGKRRRHRSKSRKHKKHIKSHRKTHRKNKRRGGRK